MPKAFLPLLASLLLCGAATGALVATTSARAQNETHKPVMLAQNTEAPAAAPTMNRMHRFSPADLAAFHKQRCEDRYAGAVGRMAYLETRLNLTASQQSQFAAWRSVRLEIAKRAADACAQRDISQASRQISPVDRMARMEDRLKQRVAGLDAERPVFAALYNALSPDQREALALQRRPMMRGGMARHRGMMGHGMMKPGTMRHNSGPGPMNGPPATPTQQ